MVLIKAADAAVIQLYALFVHAFTNDRLSRRTFQDMTAHRITALSQLLETW